METQNNFLIEVVSDGRTGEQLIVDLKKQKFNTSDDCIQILQHKDFVPTKGTKYKAVVIFGNEIEEDAERTIASIHALAKQRGYLKTHMELAPLFREKISDEEMERMGVWSLVIMSDTIKDPFGDPRLLALRRVIVGRELIAYHDYPGLKWNRGFGFVFLAPQD